MNARVLCIPLTLILSVAVTAAAIDTNLLKERTASASAAAQYLQQLLEEAQAKAEAVIASRPPRLSPAVATPTEPPLLTRLRTAAPNLFTNGQPTRAAKLLLDAPRTGKATHQFGQSNGVLPRTDSLKLLQRTQLRDVRKIQKNASLQSANVAESGATLELAGSGRLVLADIEYNSGVTWFSLLLIDAPLDEWWDIFATPTLSPNGWRPAFVGPPDAVADNVQLFVIGAEGQYERMFFQTFLHQDSDYDGISDGNEVVLFKTDPLNPDSNNNGVADGDEDTDGDGFSNSYELALGVDPLTAQPTTDSDGDGLPDWVETMITRYTGDTFPAPNADSDGDGINNITEWLTGLDPSWAGDIVLRNFAYLPDDQRAVRHRNIEFQSSGGGALVASETIPEEAYLDVSFANFYGTAAQLTVLKDRDSNGNNVPGTDTFKWGAACQGAGVIPVPNLPAPNPADGNVDETNLLLSVTSCLTAVWSAAKVTEHLQTLSEPTLVFIQQRSFTKMWIPFPDASNNHHRPAASARIAFAHEDIDR